MLPGRLPYTLDVPVFRFRAIAVLAGRAALGGPREAVLAVYVGARLAHDTLPERGVLPEARKKRAEAARGWMSALAVPVGARPALIELLMATPGTPAEVAPLLRRVTTVTAAHLDAGARLELERLADSLDASTKACSPPS